MSAFFPYQSWRPWLALTLPPRCAGRPEWRLHCGSRPTPPFARSWTRRRSPSLWRSQCAESGPRGAQATALWWTRWRAETHGQPSGEDQITEISITKITGIPGHRDHRSKRWPVTEMTDLRDHRSQVTEITEITDLRGSEWKHGNSTVERGGVGVSRNA